MSSISLTVPGPLRGRVVHSTWMRSGVISDPGHDDDVPGIHGTRTRSRIHCLLVLGPEVRVCLLGIGSH